EIIRQLLSRVAMYVARHGDGLASPDVVLLDLPIYAGERVEVHLTLGGGERIVLGDADVIDVRSHEGVATEGDHRVVEVPDTRHPCDEGAHDRVLPVDRCVRLGEGRTDLIARAGIEVRDGRADALVATTPRVVDDRPVAQVLALPFDDHRGRVVVVTRVRNLDIEVGRTRLSRHVENREGVVDRLGNGDRVTELRQPAHPIGVRVDEADVVGDIGGNTTGAWGSILHALPPAVRS